MFFRVKLYWAMWFYHCYRWFFPCFPPFPPFFPIIAIIAIDSSMPSHDDIAAQLLAFHGLEEIQRQTPRRSRRSRGSRCAERAQRRAVGNHLEKWLDQWIDWLRIGKGFDKDRMQRNGFGAE